MPDQMTTGQQPTTEGTIMAEKIEATVTEDTDGETVVTLRASRDTVHRLALNLIESDRASFQTIGEQVAAGMIRNAMNRDGGARAIGTCFDCGQSIFDDENWVNVRVPGDVPAMSHLECATA